MGSSDVVTASIGSRIMAALIDLLVDLGPTAIVATVGVTTGNIPAEGGDSDQYTTSGNWMMGLSIGLLFAIVIYQLYREGSTGQSIGKRIVGIKTVSASGPRRPLGFAILLRPNLVDSIVIEVEADKRQASAGPPSPQP
jgi:uncharacterized RDD family membrane protein YckC